MAKNKSKSQRKDGKSRKVSSDSSTPTQKEDEAKSFPANPIAPNRPALIVSAVLFFSFVCYLLVMAVLVSLGLA